jgi:hypothetical protein
VVRHKFALRMSPRLLLSAISSNLIQSSHSGLRIFYKIFCFSRCFMFLFDLHTRIKVICRHCRVLKFTITTCPQTTEKAKKKQNPAVIMFLILLMVGTNIKHFLCVKVGNLFLPPPPLKEFILEFECFYDRD